MEKRIPSIDEFINESTKIKKGDKIMGATQNGKPEDSGYTFVRFESATEVFVRNSDGQIDRYIKSPNFAGYHLIINDVDYEFAENMDEM